MESNAQEDAYPIDVDDANDADDSPDYLSRTPRWRRLSLTQPATPFDGTPAGAPPPFPHQRHTDSTAFCKKDNAEGDAEDERKMPAETEGNSGHMKSNEQREHSNPVQVESHGHLDEVGHSASGAVAAAAPHQQQAHHHHQQVLPPAPSSSPTHHPPAQTRSSALLSAQYYANCALSRIDPVIADRAVKSVHSAFKYWWDQGNIAERMVGSGDAEVTELRVNRQESSSVASSDVGWGVGVGDGGGGYRDDAASAASVASSMGRAAAAVGGVSATAANAARSAPGYAIPTSVTVHSSPDRSRTSAGTSTGGKRPWKADDNSAHGDALWSEEENNRKKRRQQTQHPVASASTSTSAPIPARTEMVRSEMASFLRQQQYRSELQQTKTALLHALQMTGGDVTADPFLHALKRLRGLYKRSGLDCRKAATSFSASAAAAAGVTENSAAPSARLEGMWLTLSRPNYHDCLGVNSSKEYMYTLGRMSFGFYRPTSMVCSVQGVFNPVHSVNVKDLDEVESVPRGLRKELYEGRTLLRTYNIVTAFSIEPSSPLFGPNSPNVVVSRPIRGIMTTFGYVLPDPSTPNRLSVWFTGGTIEVDDETDLDEWKRILGDDDAGSVATAQSGLMAPPRPGPSLSEKAKLLAAKLLLGASVPKGLEEDGSMNFKLNRPVGGHGSAYVDILYLDDTLRIMQGHHGSVYVMARVPGS